MMMEALGPGRKEVKAVELLAARGGMHKFYFAFP